ncbi:hypothetical protein N7456_001231 [Penicillium angulare]|uniref:Uncharacterized protein n=1 Tax=Penicillium angulare TaxID=116970 RepID=A0A9W9KSM5_9EURO|nr:hypothetical protein N7456_001231 [Penicillium angulare]
MFLKDIFRFWFLPNSRSSNDDFDTLAEVEFPAIPKSEEVHFTEHRNIRHRSGSSQEIRQNIRNHIASLTERNEGLASALQKITGEAKVLRQRLTEANEEIRGLKQAYTIGEEKARRLNEQLEESSRELSTVFQSNNKLAIKLTKLQKYTDQLADDEIQRMVGQVYHNLEKWVKNHYVQPFTEELSANMKSDGAKYPSDNLDAFFHFYSDLSWHIYERFLGRIMVGTGNSLLANDLSMIDAQVRKLCELVQVYRNILRNIMLNNTMTLGPTHVAQNWRSAMSLALCSLEDNNPDCYYTHFINFVETAATYSSKNSEKRKEQLMTVVQKLEGQIELYRFHWIEPNSVFDEAEMSSFTGAWQAGALVQYPLVPALYKVLSGGERVLVEKAIVKPYVFSKGVETLDQSLV